jgi:hypothetical protein
MALGYADRGNSGSSSIYSDAWDGRSWKPKTMPRPLSNGNLTGLSCVFADRCVTVGETGPFRTLAGVWDGRSWKVDGTPTPSDHGFLNGVSCWSSTGCTAVGVHDLGPDTNKPLAETLG